MKKITLKQWIFILIAYLIFFFSVYLMTEIFKDNGIDLRDEYAIMNQEREL